MCTRAARILEESLEKAAIMRGARLSAIACALVAAFILMPLVAADEHVVQRGEKGPRTNMIQWTISPACYTTWQLKVDNEGLRSVMIEVYDNTTFVPELVWEEKIRFASLGAYPKGTVFSSEIPLGKCRFYEVCAYPSGSKGSWARLTDVFPMNQPPVAEFSYYVDGLTVFVSADGTMDPDGAIRKISWDWGDGSSREGWTGSHLYSSPGLYTITMTAFDELGATGSTSKQVQVPPWVLPIASFTHSVLGLTVYVDASASTDPDGTLVDYHWSWGDGAEGTGVVTSHSYQVVGSYTIGLAVTDDDGFTASTSVFVPSSAQLWLRFLVNERCPSLTQIPSTCDLFHTIIFS